MFKKSKKNGSLSFGRKMGYGLGDFSSQFAYSTASLYLFYFFTDIALISAASAGIIMMVSRFWDAVTDPLAGYLSDTTKSRWGQKRPFLLYLAVPMGIVIALLFQSPELSSQGKFLYYLIMSLVLWTVYTFVFIPYQALLPNISEDFHERSQLAGFAKLLTIIALIFISAFTKPFAASFETEAKGFSVLAVIYGAICTTGILITFLSTRETVRVDDKIRYKPKEIFPLIVKNTPFLLTNLANFFAFIVFSITGAALNYFFKYVLEAEQLVAIAFTCIFVIAAFAMPLCIYLSGKIGKKRVYAGSVLIYMIMFAILFFIKDVNWFILIPTFILGGLGFSGINFGSMALIPDTVEYGYWKTGKRIEGIQYGISNFATKMSVSVSGLIIGLSLERGGYVANAVQSPESLMMIRIVSSLIPVALLFLAFLSLLKYPITEEFYGNMKKEIDSREKVV